MSEYLFQNMLADQLRCLSLGERENRQPLSGESKALDRAGVSALNRGAHSASGSDVRPKKDAGCQFPLPAGEGQGEGGTRGSQPKRPDEFCKLSTKRVHAGRRASLNCLSGVAEFTLLPNASAVFDSESSPTLQAVGSGGKFMGSGLVGMVCPSGAGGRLAPVARARARRGLARDGH